MTTMSEAEKLASKTSSGQPMGICSAVSDIGTITNRVYNQPHKFLDDSYDTRKGWFNPTFSRSYVIPHPQETTNNFNIRKSSSTYRAFLKSIINTTVDPLFRGELTIESKDSFLTFNQSVKNIVDNFNIKLFTMKAMKYFYLHDLTYTVAEPPMDGSFVVGDGLPVTYTVSIDDIYKETKIVNTDDFTELNYRIDKSFYNEDTNENIAYHTINKYTTIEFKTTTELYIDADGNYHGGDERKDTDKDWVRSTLDDKLIQDFDYETIPVFTLKAKIDTTKRSTPEMHDLAISCWDYFNTCSLHKELERKCTNPILTMQTNGGAVTGVVIGANNALGYPAELDRPQYLELDMSAHEELRTSKNELKQDIYKLYLQGLQTDETKFTSEDSNEISESLFYNKVSSLSEFLKEYVDLLITNITYVLLDGKTQKKDIKKKVDNLEIDFHFDFDMDREIGNIAWWELLSELYTASDDAVKRNRLIEELEQKLGITDKTKIKTKTKE